MTDLNTEGSLLELAESAVRRAFGHFDKPDDDWAATLMHLTPRRDKCIVDLSMRGPDKDATSARMERTLAGMHAVDAVFVASSWITEIEGERPSQAPDRREAITMHHFTRDSAEAFYADIDRFDDRPPRLGRFTLMATDLGVDGRFADAMRRGIGVNDSGEDPEAALAAADAAFAARQAFEARRTNSTPNTPCSRATATCSALAAIMAARPRPR